ncbi:phosphate ABC transporter permease PstA [Methylosinus sp. H3A]|uniref:phosphate ABC transporter permease PstA n=1 Tax=Methylosinus sp. H3A TaxID=2785786 RepID=UPI0018C23E41|nr:phosphate ABC transporter permease PstA [Methylosinus sp. H3A]MBG0808032.1 phosphate ABC transporter permease PstA [Methylosinus sp. H3A]
MRDAVEYAKAALCSRDALIRTVIWIAASILAMAFVWLLFDLLRQGYGRIDWSFLTTAPRNAGRDGGIAPILVSTFLIIVVAMVLAGPLGLATALFLSDFARAGGRLARWTGLSLDVLAGTPSIIFGLFGGAFFCVFLGLGFSILSGGMTLACMALPVLIRTIESGLRATPDEWRLGAAALGVSRATMLWRIVIPAAAPSLAAGLMLGIGRAMAETAALMFTSGYVDRMPSSLFDSGRALSVHIYDLTMNVSGGDRNAYASALALIALLIASNSAALWLSDLLFSRRIARS